MQFEKLFVIKEIFNKIPSKRIKILFSQFIKILVQKKYHQEYKSPKMFTIKNLLRDTGGNTGVAFLSAAWYYSSIVPCDSYPCCLRMWPPPADRPLNWHCPTVDPELACNRGINDTSHQRVKLLLVHLTCIHI